MNDFNLQKFLIENKMTRNSQLLSENRHEAANYALKILTNFKRSTPLDVPTILRKLESLKDYIENQYDTEEMGAEDAYVALEDLEDALNNGEDIITAIDNAISNLD